MIVPKLSGHCDVISKRPWRHQQNNNRTNETRGRIVKIVFVIFIYGFVMSCKKWNNVCTLVTNYFCTHSSDFHSTFGRSSPVWIIDSSSLAGRPNNGPYVSAANVTNVSTWWRHQLEMFFRITGHLCREFTSHRWIPSTKPRDAELSYFLWSLPE